MLRPIAFARSAATSSRIIGLLKRRPSAAALIARIRALADECKTVSESTLRRRIDAAGDQISGGNSPTCPEILIEVFALTTEAMRRVTGMVYYDVQLAGGLGLANGAVVEMQTGEGKTIVIALPTVLHALTGKGVHVATTNHYLASRDHQQLRPVYNILGISSNLLPEDSNPQDTKLAYEAQITYGTGFQFGFDYLRDQIALRDCENIGQGSDVLFHLTHRSRPVPVRQRSREFAIIDEIDSVMLDEANTPLLMSGASNSAPTTVAYQLAQETVDSMIADQHYVHQVATRSVELTDQGYQHVLSVHEQHIQIRLSRPWISYIYNALRAKAVFQRDEEYIVDEGKVQIVDPKTGRIHPDRTWREGLHQAIEAKEEVEITPPNETQARITRQRYFAMYNQVCGLTGTAGGSETEFRSTYGLPIVTIPRNRECLRQCLPTRYFVSAEQKLKAVVRELQAMHQRSRPVLVGTRTIKSSQQIADALAALGLPFVVLNGTQDGDEADIVGKAGQCGAITIATNIAGRGTDIPIDSEAKKLGGLHVLSTEHHPSIRVDRQLIGRSARQGDPGSSQFLVAADDELFAMHAPELAGQMVRRADPNGECQRDFSREILRLQQRLESKAYQARLQMHRQDVRRERILDAALLRGDKCHT